MKMIHRLTSCALLAQLLLSVAVAQEASAPPTDLVSKTLKTLQGKGIELDKDVAGAGAIEGILRTFDKQARILTPDEVKALWQKQTGKLQGIGVRLSMTNGTPRVIAVAENSPAATAGVEVGDLITKINGGVVTNSYLAAVSRLLHPDEEEEITLQVKRPGTELEPLSITTALLQTAPVETAELLPRQLGYIRVNGIYEGVGEQLTTLLRTWAEENVFGIVIDLRGANGGDTESAAKIGGMYGDPGGLVCAIRTLDDQDTAVFKAPAESGHDMPTMVLVDKDTHGAAELLAAALKRSARGAMLLGEQTRGDAGVREFLEFGPNRTAYVATHRLVMADGTVYDGTSGIVPDVTVLTLVDTTADPETDNALIMLKRPTLDEEIEDRHLRERVKGDVVLRRAVDVLLGLKAMDIRGFRASHSAD